MSSHLTVVLVRHGTHGLLGKRLVGRMPGVALDETGRNEVAQLAGRMRGKSFAALYASPIQRTQETAEPIAQALGLEVQTEEALTEIDLGAWTGMRHADLADDERWHRWNNQRAEASPPEGESMRAAGRRIVDQIEVWRAKHPDGRIVAVSHGDVIKAAICHYLDLSLDRYAAFEIDPASCSAVVVWEGGGKVLALNAKEWP